MGSMKNSTTNRRATTLVETLVVLLSVVVFMLLFMAVTSNAVPMRMLTGEEVSKANLVDIHEAHVLYANNNGGKQWSAHLDNFGNTLGNCSQYVATVGCPPQQIMGFDANGGQWGYWAGGAMCPPQYPSGCGNWPVYLPNAWSGNWFGSWNTLQVKSFHDYLNGRFYDRTYYAPNDTALYAAAAPYFNSAVEFNYPPTTIAWSSYGMSPAAMWNPEVLRAPSAGGFRNPSAFAGAFERQQLAGATYPELKSLTFEKNWNQDAPTASGLPFNKSPSGRPITLFYDGHTDGLSNARAIEDDARVTAQGGDGLWHRGTPWGTSGYSAGVTSHSVLTTDGIRGRDIVACVTSGHVLADMLVNWGGTGSTDFNGDGVINGLDLNVLLSDWRSCP